MMTLFGLYLFPHQIMSLEVISGNSFNLLWVSQHQVDVDNLK